LTTRVDTGVGTSGTRQTAAVTEQPFEANAQFALDGTQWCRLLLPAVKPSTDVSEIDT
jgi:hypothetical protein